MRVVLHPGLKRDVRFWVGSEMYGNIAFPSTKSMIITSGYTPASFDAHRLNEHFGNYVKLHYSVSTPT